MTLLFSLLLSMPGHARVMTIEGTNANFSLRLTLSDPTGDGSFLPSATRVEEFELRFKPSAVTQSPRELFYVDTFGRMPWTIGSGDVEMLRFGRGVTSPASGVGGYFLVFKLNREARRRIKGYRYVGVGLGAYGQPRAPHHVLLLNDDADVLENFKPSLWHRLYVGDRLFLEPIVECGSRLEASGVSRARARVLRRTS